MVPEGLGTALKPAYEPIIVARKPISEKNIAANVLTHGTGALNIDGCRIGTESTLVKRPPNSLGRMNDDGWQPKPGFNGSDKGRWPANVILDEAAAEALDAQSGERHGGGTGKPLERKPLDQDGSFLRAMDAKGRSSTSYPDTGGASRFFKVVPQDDLPINQPGASRMAYHAKASRKERNSGLDGMPERDKHGLNGSRKIAHRNPDTGAVTYSDYTPANLANHHPTVKPISLMQWLVRLITPPGGTVLDPFMGSGSTGVACLREGVNFIGIELNPEYAEIARRRITGDAPLFASVEVS